MGSQKTPELRKVWKTTLAGCRFHAEAVGINHKVAPDWVHAKVWLCECGKEVCWVDGKYGRYLSNVHFRYSKGGHPNWSVTFFPHKKECKALRG